MTRTDRAYQQGLAAVAREMERLSTGALELLAGRSDERAVEARANILRQMEIMERMHANSRSKLNA